MKFALVSCPRCGNAVDPFQRVCEHCGVDLALAAILAERDLEIRFAADEKIPISPEILVPRLGQYLIEKGILDSQALDFALDYQAKQNAGETPSLIGQTLLDLGLVSKEELDQAITEQIIELQSALQRANTELENRIRERTVELERALSRLSEINQLKSNFVANVSHELRTPLTHIKGYLELLVEGDLGSLSNEQLSALLVMKKAEERLEHLIEDLIQFSLVARGDLDLRISSIDVNISLLEIKAEAIKKCKKTGLFFDTEIAENLPNIKADWSKISWVILQLIDNAVKFTPKNGRVGFRVSTPDNTVLFSISDTGIGISKQHIEEVFEPFHQLDGSATRKYGGTGLGLTLAKQIVEAHGSRITVSSTLGVGSCFKFSLPIQE
jgi:signal transduction histidine kinase